MRSCSPCSSSGVSLPGPPAATWLHETTHVHGHLSETGRTGAAPETKITMSRESQALEAYRYRSRQHEWHERRPRCKRQRQGSGQSQKRDHDRDEEGEAFRLPALGHPATLRLATDATGTDAKKRDGDKTMSEDDARHALANLLKAYPRSFPMSTLSVQTAPVVHRADYIEIDLFRCNLQRRRFAVWWHSARPGRGRPVNREVWGFLPR